MVSVFQSINLYRNRNPQEFQVQLTFKKKLLLAGMGNQSQSCIPKSLPEVNSFTKEGVTFWGGQQQGIPQKAQDIHRNYRTQSKTTLGKLSLTNLFIKYSHAIATYFKTLQFTFTLKELHCHLTKCPEHNFVCFLLRSYIIMITLILRYNF